MRSLPRKSRRAQGSLYSGVSSGIYTTREQVQRTLDEITRALALALGADESLKAHIRLATETSQYPEGKLDFAAEIDSPSNSLLMALASAAERSPSSFRAALDSVVPLEMYLPVDARVPVTLRGGPAVVVMGEGPDNGVSFGSDLGASVRVGLGPLDLTGGVGWFWFARSDSGDAADQHMLTWHGGLSF
jgi:hypothetical protein